MRFHIATVFARSITANVCGHKVRIHVFREIVNNEDRLICEITSNESLDPEIRELILETVKANEEIIRDCFDL